jgi:hypothetical protein
MSTEKSSDLIGTRTRDRPAYRTVPQLTLLRRVPVLVMALLKESKSQGSEEK